VILLDTNILLRYANSADSAHPTARAAVGTLNGAGETLCIVPQNVYEFWVAATRPLVSNGLGLSIPQCRNEVTGLKTAFTFLPDLPALFAEWEGLVSAYLCHGKVAHDAHLVAAMRTYGITRLLTFNGTDFARYPGLAVLDPATVAPPPPAGGVGS
jgi:predicted nucleic acid-binding protein